MPVTAKLSRRFYERLGDDITNELVDWLNSVDSTYRSDLREMNEANYARLMASVDQRFAEQNARIADLRADLLKWMFIYWTGTMLAVTGLVLTASRFK